VAIVNRWSRRRYPATTIPSSFAGSFNLLKQGQLFLFGCYFIEKWIEKLSFPRVVMNE
jgi:hypothetical protein